jgi:hypothetical protein
VDVVFLHPGVGPLAPPQQRVAAEGDDDFHTATIGSSHGSLKSEHIHR